MNLQTHLQSVELISEMVPYCTNKTVLCNHGNLSYFGFLSLRIVLYMISAQSVHGITVALLLLLSFLHSSFSFLSTFLFLNDVADFKSEETLTRRNHYVQKQQQQQQHNQSLRYSYFLQCCYHQTCSEKLLCQVFKRCTQINVKVTQMSLEVK